MVLTYPLIKIVSICVPPNQTCIPFAYPQINILPKYALFEWFVLILPTPCGLLTYPLWSPHVPRGVRVPQVENRCGGYACSRSESYLSLCLCTILISLCEPCKVYTCFTLFDYSLRLHHLKSTCTKSYTRSDCPSTSPGTLVTATSSTSSNRDHQTNHAVVSN